MKKLLFHCKRCAVVLLALTAAFAVGCTGDLEDEVADLTGQVEDLESQLEELEGLLEDGAITVTSVVTNSDGSKTIYFSDGSVVSTSSTSDVEVLADVDEFCVLSIEGVEYVVAKTDYVTLTDVSLKGVTDLYPVMKSGETYDITVKLNPSNTTVVPTAYYLVVVEGGSSDAGVTVPSVKSLMGTESTVVVVDSFTAPDETGTATLSVKWTGADVDSEKVLVSAEFVENTWSNGSVVAVTKEVMTDTSMGIIEGAVLITEADVTPGYWDVAYTIKHYVNENSEITLDLDEMFFNQTDFISYNIKDAQLVLTSAVYANNEDVDFAAIIESGAEGDYVSNSVFDDFSSLVTLPASWDSTTQSVGTYSYKDGKATLYFKTDEVTTTGGTEVFNLAIIFDDYYPNTSTAGVLADGVAEYYNFSGYDADNSGKNYYYSSVLGSLTYVAAASAPSPLVSRGYVVRYITLTVNDVEAQDTYSYNDYVPYGAPGATGSSLVLGNGENEEMEVELSTETYEISDITAKYTYTPGTYGYVLNSNSAYKTYVENNPTDFVKAEIETTSIVGATKDLVYAVYFENTADYAVLPGFYEFTITVKTTDSDGLETYKKYPIEVNLYAPQYYIQLNAAMSTTANVYNGTNGVENIIPLAVDATSGLYEFTTYEWYDYDLARLLDVDNVTATLESISNTSAVNAKSYTLVDQEIPNSSLYSAFDQFCYDPTSLRLTPDSEYLLDAPKANNQVWYQGLNVAFSSQVEGEENIIPVDAPSTSSADIAETVQLSTTLESGLIIPVDLFFDGVLKNAGKSGKFGVNIKLNQLASVSSTVYCLEDGEEIPTALTTTDYINYTSDLELSTSNVDSDGDIFYIDSKLTRSQPVFTNLAKEGILYNDYMAAAGASPYTFTFGLDYYAFKNLFTTNITLDNRDYTASEELSALICSQIGDGSADLFSTVDLLGADCVTYTVSDLTVAGSTQALPSGLAKTTKLIEVSDTGVIYRALPASTDSTVELKQAVKVTYTDITGKSQSSTVQVYLKY
ncbi:MAG: hypothetical protein R3Y39_07145 [Rikenellaceae bacterium]